MNSENAAKAATHLDAFHEQWAVRRAIPNQLLEDVPGLAANLRAWEHIERELNLMIIELRSSILAKDHCRESYEIPATWWDYFKRDHFPAWALRRWPVRFVKLAHIERRMCPHIARQVPDEQHMMWMHCMDTEEEDRSAPS